MCEILYRKLICQLELGHIDDAEVTVDRFIDINRSEHFSNVLLEDHVRDDHKELLDKIVDMKSINRLISLGGNCDVSNYLKKKGILTYSIFDWLMASVDSVVRIIMNDGNGLLDKVWIDNSKRATGYPVCAEYNVLCIRDFPWGSNGLPIVNETTTNKARKILKYKLDTIKNYCKEEGKIIFLRNMLENTIVHGNYCDHNMDASALNDLVRIIEEKFQIVDFQIMVFYKKEAFPQLNKANDLDTRLQLMEENEGLSYKTVIDYYLEANYINSEKEEDRSIVTESKYLIFKYYKTPPFNVENLADVFIDGHIQMWNVQKAMAAFYQRWLDHYGEKSTQAKKAYYHLGMAYLTGGETIKAAEAFRKGLELDVAG